MPSFTTPARGRYPRSNISGRVPDVLAPGVPAYNWPDRKIHVGDPGGVPLLFSQLIREFQLEVAYQPGDIIIHDGEIWIANGSIPPNQPFDPDDWQRLTSNAASSYAEPMASGILTGGVVSIASPTSVNITEGEGVVVDVSNPASPRFTRLMWAAFTATIPILSVPTRLLACIDANGNFLTLDSLTLSSDVRRDVIVLGTVRTDTVAVTLAGGSPLISGDMAETYRDELQAGKWAGWRIEGCTITCVAGNLRIGTTAGIIFSPGDRFRTVPSDPNIYQFGATAALTTTTLDRNGVTITPSDGLVKVGFWDNAGVVTPVPADQFSTQFLTIGAGAAPLAQLGQRLYASLDAALSRLSIDYEEHVVAVRQRGRILFAAVIARGDATNLADPGQALLVPALLGRTSPFTYRPPASAAEDLSAYYRLDGTRTLTGNMNAGGFRIDNAIIDGGTY